MSRPETPDPDLPQDPGIPGADVISDPSDAPLPVEKDEDAEAREAPESDDEGHMHHAEVKRLAAPDR
jgi:hypothetical protein